MKPVQAAQWNGIVVRLRNYYRKRGDICTRRDELYMRWHGDLYPKVQIVKDLRFLWLTVSYILLHPVRLWRDHIFRMRRRLSPALS
jgi:hypothetical protein